jgi:hypothetical protein
MGQSVRVHSLESLEKFRVALIEFGQDAKDTLSATEMHIHRTFDWLEEKAKYWTHEIKRRREELTRAKIELDQRKFADRNGRGPGHSSQEKQFRKAQARLKEAEQKFENCKRWKPLLEHAVHEYLGPARQLNGAIDTDLTQSAILLKQKVIALEQYLALQAPSLGDMGPASETSGAGVGIQAEVVESSFQKPVREEEPSAAAVPQEEEGVSEEPALSGMGTSPAERRN